MLRAILFDFNGVLVDDEPLHLELFQKVLAEEGIDLSSEQYYAEYLGFDDQACFETVLTRHGVEATSANVSRLIARKAAYYHGRVRESGFPFFPGAAELVADVVGEGLILGVVSGALRDEVEGGLTQLGVRSHFKCLVTADDVERSKPDPEGYSKGLGLLNSTPPLPSRLIHPHEVLAIEDSPAGLQAAAAAGLATLGVAQTYSEDELRDADRVARSLVDLSGAQIRKLFGG